MPTRERHTHGQGVKEGRRNAPSACVASIVCRNGLKSCTLTKTGSKVTSACFVAHRCKSRSTFCEHMPRAPKAAKRLTDDAPAWSSSIAMANRWAFAGLISPVPRFSINSWMTRERFCTRPGGGTPTDVDPFSCSHCDPNIHAKTSPDTSTHPT